MAAVVGLVIGLMATGCGADQQRPQAAAAAAPVDTPGDSRAAQHRRGDGRRHARRRPAVHAARTPLVADTGLSFRNSFSPYPLCCPARASFLTGQYPHNHRILSNEEPWGFGAFDDRATIATSLQAAGYRTGFVGKYLNNYGAVPSAVTGEPSWHYVPAGWSDWRGLVQLPPGSRIRNGGTYDYYHPIFNVDGRIDNTHRGEYQTGVVGRFARELLARYAVEQDPFFLYLSALAPHTGFPKEPDDLAIDQRGRHRLDPDPGPAGLGKGKYDEVVTRSPGIPALGQPEVDVTDKPAAVREPALDDP